MQQLRGMCTDNPHQGRGFGGQLLACMEAAILKNSDTRLFWCNACVLAIPVLSKTRLGHRLGYL